MKAPHRPQVWVVLVSCDQSAAVNPQNMRERLRQTVPVAPPVDRATLAVADGEEPATAVDAGFALADFAPDVGVHAACGDCPPASDSPPAANTPPRTPAEKPRGWWRWWRSPARQDRMLAAGTVIEHLTDTESKQDRLAVACDARL